jgi:hypothetical protein
MGRVDDIRKRLEAATPGPWGCIEMVTGGGKRPIVFLARKDDPTSSRYPHWDGLSNRVADLPRGRQAPYDGDLIAHAPTDIAYLLRLVNELESEIMDVVYDDGELGRRFKAARKRAEPAPISEKVHDG